LDAGVQALMACVTSGGKVLVCGEGSSAALAQYFASLFVGGFERERPELAAVALRHEGLGDPAYASLARQVRALGQAGDVLLLLTTNGEEEGLMRALHAAHERDMTVIALTGKGGGAGVYRHYLTCVCWGGSFNNCNGGSTPLAFPPCDLDWRVNTAGTGMAIIYWKD
jgi:phosphoheptose isomerase